MSRILIAYSSRYGQTHKIAKRIAQRARDRGHDAEVRDAGDLGPEDDLLQFDAVVLGGGVHRGKYPREVSELAQKRKGELERIPSAFFSVSMSAASDDGPSRSETEGYLAHFAEETGWRPAKVASFGGTLAYSRYNFLLRQVMKLISRRVGRPTDTSHDHEFTDWDEVDRFTDDLLEGIAPPSPEPPPAQPAI